MQGYPNIYVHVKTIHMAARHSCTSVAGGHPRIFDHTKGAVRVDTGVSKTIGSANTYALTRHCYVFFKINNCYCNDR